MIDKNKVKSAAQGYCDATYGTLDRHPLIAEAFKEGANWAINEFLKDLWHPASEIPCEGKYLIVEYNITDTIKDYLSLKRENGCIGWDWISHCKYSSATRWLYIDDLL